MKMKFTFEPELRGTMEKVFENEKAACEKAAGGIRMRVFRGLLSRKMGMEVKPAVTYDFISDTEAEFEIVTGMEGMPHAKSALKLFREYEKISEGKIKVEEMK